MATLVGTQGNIADAIKALVELEYDAVEAYNEAVNRLRSESYKAQMSKFREDHLNHIRLLSATLARHDEKVPTEGDMKKYLTKGKVVIGEMLAELLNKGENLEKIDRAILTAMKDNENDLYTAYHDMNNRDDLWNDIVEVIQNGLSDETRHRDWIAQTIDASSMKA